MVKSIRQLQTGCAAGRPLWCIEGRHQILELGPQTECYATGFVLSGITKPSVFSLILSFILRWSYSWLDYGMTIVLSCLEESSSKGSLWWTVYLT